MTDERMDYWIAYVVELLPHFRLRDWSVRLKDDPPDGDDAVASIEPIYGRKVAYLRLGKDFESDTPNEQRATICHELMHLHLQPIADVYNRVMDGRTEGWLRLGNEFHREAIEHATDMLAEVLAPFLPLPPAEDAEEAA